MRGFSIIPPLALALLSSVAIAQDEEERDCSYDSKYECIEPEARGSVEFEFKPLFPSNAQFVYAFAAGYEPDYSNNDDEEEDENTRTPETRVGFWLEYPEADLSPSSEMETSLVFLMHENITGTPSGGNNGCDGIWGARCSSGIAEVIKSEITTTPSSFGPSLGQVLTKLFIWDGIWDELDPESNALRNLTTCPKGVLKEFYMLDYRKSILAMESEESDTAIKPSGNATYPFVFAEKSNMTYEEQIDRVAVAMILRKPLEEELFKDPDNLQLEMACVKAKPQEGEDSGEGSNSGQGSNSGEGGNSGEGSAARLGVWSTALVSSAALGLGFMLV